MRYWLEVVTRAITIEIPLGRRVAVCIAAITLAAILFRGQLASGLISRGDEFLQLGAVSRAERYYSRALAVDGNSTAAAERLAFAGLLLKTPGTLREAVAVATDALGREPGNVALLNDRGLAFNALGDFESARRDFVELAARDGDVRYYEFAAQAARRSGDTVAAARLFARVIALNPKFEPARRALANLAAKR
jgi:tetratricopeptide (TPR) repeat protein